ncbi:molybdopterin oxidoreductase family protein [Rubrobacter indicoceani]|uniref:molybdopterin oxidoreductase family protein n=1 Tax=Rubrobacter indicoceani TaxID=2051957 RepID=UPI0013C4830B|nr:nitrate reductase [Rubrobacter indicoceani]
MSEKVKPAKSAAGWTRSTCPYCGVGCGVEAQVKSGRIAKIRGDGRHPANFGRLCPKPAGLPDAVAHDDRLKFPMRRTAKGGELQRISWEEALDELAEKLSGALEVGPRAAAFYISGQLLTEDYYVVNKLVKGFLGTNNLDSNSRLCMTSAVEGYRGAFGSDGPPAGYADIARTECMLVWGSNTAECHPIVFGRMKERRKDPAVGVIVVDPRRTKTCDIADVYLPVRPGTDLALANAMLRVLVAEDLVDRRYIERYTTGFEATLREASEWSPGRAARVCGVPGGEIVRAARMFGGAKSALSLWTMGVNQSTVGTLKNRGIINLHLATGNLGKPGAGPLSLTGQPNAMGGRETGGLCAGLPGYRTVTDDEHRREVEEYWGVEAGSISGEPGLPATQMFRSAEAGDVDFMWVVATNPAVSMPDLTRTKHALANVPYLVVSDAYPTETTRYADLVLPAAGWGEKEGTMTNSERRVSLVAKLVEPVGESRADREVFSELAERLGFAKDFAWNSAAEVFEEFVGLTRGTPVEMSGLTRGRLTERPAQWPVPASLFDEDRIGLVPRSAPSFGLREPDEHPGTPRLYVGGRFNTPDGKARFCPTPHETLWESPSAEYPLTLLTGRIKNQWHTMTRTGRSPKLTRGLEGGPFVEVHPKTAKGAGLADGEAAKIASERGSFTAKVLVTEDIRPGAVFAPFHWGDLWTDGGPVNETTHDASDPVSREPELKGAAVRLEPVTGEPPRSLGFPVAAGRSRR